MPDDIGWPGDPIAKRSATGERPPPIAAAKLRTTRLILCGIMSTAHFHLMLTHVPVLGTVFALLLLTAGFLKRSDELKKTALWTFALCAVLAIPVFLTGEAAEDLVERLPGASKEAIETHEEIAGFAFGFILSLGAVALGGLTLLRQRLVPQWFTVCMLTLAIATSGLLAWTAHLGGKVRHTEITLSDANVPE